MYIYIYICVCVCACVRVCPSADLPCEICGSILSIITALQGGVKLPSGFNLYLKSNAAMADRRGFFHSDLTDDFFAQVARGAGLRLVSWRESMLATNNSRNVRMMALGDLGERIHGMRCFHVDGIDYQTDRKRSLSVVMKSKHST